MSDNEIINEGLQRKRKLNLLDFIKNDGHEQLEQENPNKFEPMNFQRPTTGLGGPKPRDDYDDYEGGEDVEMEDYDSDIRPSFGVGKNHNMLFTQSTPMMFQKASDTKDEDIIPQEQPKEEVKPKLSYSDVEALENKPTSVTKNTFKGKKYGIGAALLKKMGYIEGQGLGKHGQGITQPIEQDVRKVGVGIGGGVVKSTKKAKGKIDVDLSEDDDSSDEEYYKDVSKKSLYQIIVELEDKGISVPAEIKKISDVNVQDSHKPFIMLKKAGNNNLQELTNTLDNLNNDLEESMASLKMAEYEEKELSDSANDMRSLLESYEQLSEKLDSLSEIVNNPDLQLSLKSKTLRETISTFSDFDFSKIPDIEIQKTIIVAIKPIIIDLFARWDPLDFTDDFVLEELISWKEAIPSDQNELYGELSYFQSLLYSIWYPKIVDALSEWTVDQPNVAITLLLDWNEVIDKSVVDYLTNNIVKPKIIQAIEDWNPLTPTDNSPIVWIFEYVPYLKDSLDEIKQELVNKYSLLLEHWSPADNIDGLASFRELIGYESFKGLIKRKLVPRLVKLLNTNISFMNQNFEALDILQKWVNFISHDSLEVLFRLGFFNQWKRSLYHELHHRDSNFGDISSTFEKWVMKLQVFHDYINFIQSEVYEALDMINNYLDNNKLVPIHNSSVTISKIVELATQDHTRKKTVEENVQGIPSHRLQISFKEVVESYCAANNLFITPIKNDLSSGHSLMKISANINGKDGLVAYIEEDVLWIKGTNGRFEPISLDTLQNRF